MEPRSGAIPRDVRVRHPSVREMRHKSQAGPEARHLPFSINTVGHQDVVLLQFLAAENPARCLAYLC